MSHPNKFHFTRDTLEKLRQMKAEDDCLTKKEACCRLGVSLQTVNRAASEAGLREELTDLFPPFTYRPQKSSKSGHVGIRHVKAGLIRAPLQTNLLDPAVGWLTGNWRAHA